MLRSIWRTMRTKLETKALLKLDDLLAEMQYVYVHQQDQMTGATGKELVSSLLNTLEVARLDHAQELERLMSYLYSIGQNEGESVTLFTWDGVRSTQRYAVYRMDRSLGWQQELLWERPGRSTASLTTMDHRRLERLLQAWRCLESSGQKDSLLFQKTFRLKKSRSGQKETLSLMPRRPPRRWRAWSCATS